MDEVEHRRRRVRGGKGEAPAARVVREPAAEPPRAEPPRAEPSRSEPSRSEPPEVRPPGRHGHEPDAHAHGHPSHSSDDSERGLRGLIGGGSTQVGVTAAMRARDAARPTDQDIAHAEATLTIVHRGWQPRDGQP
jgi:hypothetical protein